MEDIFDKLIENHDDENNENEQPKDDDESNNTKRIVKPTRRVVQKRSTLDVVRLTGPRGIGSLENLAKNVVLKGKGHEKEDLSKIISCLYYWTHRLYPKMTFEDCLEKIEILGKKRPTQTYLTKMRLGMIEEVAVIPDVDEDKPSVNETADSFSRLIETSRPPDTPTLSEEQKERILKNRMLAQARRAAKLQQINNQQVSNDDGNVAL